MTAYRLPIRLPAKSAADLIPVGRTFFVEKRKRRKPHLKEKIRLCGERKLNLLNIKMMLRGSLTSDKNK